MRYQLSRLAGAFLLCLSFSPLLCQASPPVDVVLHAAFPAPPYLTELLETAAEENATAYFPLLDRIADGHFDPAKTDKALYELFLKTLKDDGHISDEQGLSSFKLALSLHSLAPRIAAHYHFYNTSVSALRGGSESGDSWLHFAGTLYDSPDLGSGVAETQAGQATSGALPFDRILGDLDSGTPAILYTDITSSSFRRFHKTVSGTSQKGKTSYRIRYKPTIGATRPLAVSGYGVEMALKRTDYIVVDDREVPAAEEGHPGSASQNVLVDDQVTELRPLSSSELLEMDLKAAAFVLASEDKLDTLVKLTQDFPKHSSRILSTEVHPDFRREMSTNTATLLPPGYNAFWINGQQILERDIDIFALGDKLRRERSIVSSGQVLGFGNEETIKLITHPNISEVAMAQESQRYDWRDDNEGGFVIIWMNNIKQDSRYQEWPSDVQSLLQRTFPGQLPSVRKDIHNIIVPLDFSNKTDVTLLVETLQEFVTRSVPIRVGLVPQTSSIEAEQHAAVVYHLTETYGLGTTLAYLSVVAEGKGRKAKGPTLAHFNEAIKDRRVRKNRDTLSLSEVLSDVVLKLRIATAQGYLRRLGAEGSDTISFVNGVALPLGDDWLQSMSNQISSDLRAIQQKVYMKQITDDTDIPATLLKSAMDRRNPLIVVDSKNVKYVDLGKLDEIKSGQVGDIPGFHASVGTEHDVLAQYILLTDLNSDYGFDLLKMAAMFKEEHENVELLVIHTGETHDGDSADGIRQILLESGDDMAMKLLSFEWRSAADEPSSSPANAKFWHSGQRVTAAAGVKKGESAIIASGRLLGPFDSKVRLTPDDLDMLLQFESKQRLKPVAVALKSMGLSERARDANAFSRLANIVALSGKSDVPEGIFEGPPSFRSQISEQIKYEHTGFLLGDKSTASVQVVVAVDPASEVAQTWVPVIKVLSEVAGVHIRLHLNPKEKLEELPVKRFYRQVVASAPSFDDAGNIIEQGAHFAGLPDDALLTIGMDLPPAWLVSPKDSVHDLDNLKLSSLKTDKVEAKYQLDNILIEGHTRDLTSGGAPRGTQLILSTGQGERFADTIIMANLGYFQFKANPGYYNLSLQKGRSSEVFNIDSAGSLGYDINIVDTGTTIALTSFRGATIYPRLSRKPGMEEEDVLEPSRSTLEKTVEGLAGSAQGVLSAIGLDGTGAAGWLSKASQKVVSYSGSISSSKAVSTLPHADINIFSVASGHLYERMLNIMMVSVMKHTTHTVKFWFIEQFLSPSFKAFLPILAEEYGFRYEMVTFKWPHWLRGQKEKQREIWGYKILFLDVLFPLDLDKVIFVDADQIVRTDMYELVQYDLKGAPYGFTPMCDSRTEMEGFRFWKQGYWKNFLRGLPYHISALYVVDLASFRQMAAGDRLRQQYHQLSADPGSLSNLDQDLPNHMQHVLPIHSLPQEWLWCETWCSDESLGVAKTIDLCNNPQTKEPKLERARRQVPEWTMYDDEIAALAKRKQGAATALPGLGEGKGEQERLQAEEYQRKQQEEARKRMKDEL